MLLLASQSCLCALKIEDRLEFYSVMLVFSLATAKVKDLFQTSYRGAVLVGPVAGLNQHAPRTDPIIGKFLVFENRTGSHLIQPWTGPTRPVLTSSSWVEPDLVLRLNQNQCSPSTQKEEKTKRKWLERRALLGNPCKCWLSSYYCHMTFPLTMNESLQCSRCGKDAFEGKLIRIRLLC